MHLRYVLLMAVATLAASSSVSAAIVSDDTKMVLASHAYPIDSVHEEYEGKRRLRTSGKKTAESDRETGPVFMEHKLEKALTNPKKTKRLFQSWYKKGITAKDVSSGLGQSENRELNPTYTKLASGYTAYVKEQESLERV